ncbi:phosphatidylinositol N-acetylglucosaminyltransferase subunit H-like [Penaeus japonicus]|uniref:phosphatidylinositol N-acetylglucosaminyltransferase subunit H-like n=1 Tax=Penaeus japonicus TaxID=27405 RepID=UPI001C70AFD5|nr:phosphatidylinositol N-acetylglucosaminyltransferase subunit H-like [Penaeus japonicus]
MMMESLLFRDVRGDVIFVEERLEPASCNKRATEFSVSSSRIQFLPWLGYTSVLAAIAFLAQLHTLHPAWLLTAVITQLATLLYRIHRKVVSETLLVVAGLGIQTTTTFYTGRQHTRFIPWGDIIDVIIAETITMQRVLFYMALLVRAEGTKVNQKLLPLFMNTWPQLACLRHIYCACQEVLSPNSKLK